MILVKDNNGKIHQTTDGTNVIVPSLNVAQEILWTNPNPNQNFVAQTVNLSDNPFNYDYIRILYNDDKRGNATGYSVIDIKPSDSNFVATIGLVIYSDSNRVTRQIYHPTENSISFNAAKAQNGENWNDWIIPYQIIGLKFIDTLNYSTEEQYTGKHWIDGKKIYQKTLEYTSGWRVGGDATLTYSIPNIDNITNFNSIMYRNNGMVITEQQVVNIDDRNWSLQIYNVKSNELGIFIGSHYTNTDAINKMLLIFEYTKTTE